jgi:hypothetical protein
MMILPAAGDAARLASVLRQYPRWSFFWDKRHAVWRAAEDDLNRPSTPKARTWTQ